MKLINKFVITTLCFFVSILGFGQQFSITGKILDGANQPIAFANVVLLKSLDSTIVTGTTSDDFGKFSINKVESGNYIIKASFIGFEDFSERVLIENNIELKTIKLLESAELLGEVEIIFKKPTVKKQADRLVFNIESTALTEGNIMDALGRTPSVVIISNEIKIFGRETPSIYINDKKVHLSSNEIIALLEGTSASNIKSIEVITNPPASYDAESGAVINIVMSKNLITGYSGSIFSNYTQGVFPKQNFGMSNFFKNSKIDFFANYSYNHDKINRVNEEFVDYSPEIWNSHVDRNTWSESHNFNMNFDYLINDNNTLSLSSNMQFLPYFKYIIKNNTLITNASQTGFNSTNLSRDEKQNLGFDLDYVHNFKEEKSKLSFNSHYTTYDYQREQDVNSNNFFTDDFLDYRTAFNTIANQETEIFTSQTDYSLSIDDSSTFEIGAKFSNIETKSDITQYDIINNDVVLNPDNTDAFDYDEMVLAGYLSFEKRWKKWSINAGLRLEQTKVEGKSVLTNQINKQDYLDWFPTGSISYQATDKISIYANYKRNIQRPSYVDLNPFKFFFNDNAYVAGNPELQPVYTDRFQIGTAISKNYIIEVFYKINNGSIFELPIQDNDNNIIAYTPLNIKESNELGLEFFAFFNPSDVWFVSFVNSLYYTKNEAVFSNNSVKLDKWSNYAELVNNVSFLKDKSLKANAMITYSLANLQGLQNVSTRVLTELSLSKTILKENGVLSLSISDFFNDHDFFVTTKYLNQNSSNFSNLDNRYVKLGFRYKFGNTKLKTNEQIKEQEELERLKKERL